MPEALFHRWSLPDALLNVWEPFQTMTGNPHPQLSGPKPHDSWKGSGVMQQGREEAGERGGGSVMTSGLDTAPGRSTQCSSCRDQPPPCTLPTHPRTSP